jgi:hypothetical protein
MASGGEGVGRGDAGGEAHYGETVAKNATVYARLGRQLDPGHWQTLIPAGSDCTIDQDGEGRATTFRWSGGALTFHRMRDPEVGPHLLGLEGYLRDIGAPAGVIVRALSTQAVYGVVADHEIEKGVPVELVMNLTQRSEGFCFVANGAVIDGEGWDLIDELQLPDADRVATRALILLAMTYRWVVESSLEDEPDVATEEWERLQQWLDDVDLSGEAEPGETEFLRRGLGTVALDDVAVHAFDAEAAHTLIWALDEFSFPTLAPRRMPANLCFMFRVPGVGPFTPGRPPALRPAAEIDRLWRQTQAVHWRLADQGLRPRQFDFAHWAEDTWFGAVDLSGLELIDGDLAIGGTSISSLDETRLWWLTRQVTEQHRALNWLIGAHPRYRSVSTPT